MRKSALAQQLAVVAGFENPRVGLEQYPTPPELAAHLVHVADLNGDVEDRTVLDLGTGTGMLALGAALRGPAGVVGIDLDADALRIARQNRRRVGTTTSISWVRADAMRAPLRRRDAAGRAGRATGSDRPPDRSDRAADRPSTTDRERTERRSRTVTVVMNPPFGAQSSNEHADRAFLETTAEVADVSYSVHNRGSQEFVESFAADNGGELSQAFRAQIDLPRQFEFHGEETREIDVEVFRIEWSGPDRSSA